MALAIHDERLTRRVGAAVLLLATLLVVFVVVLLPRLERGGVDVRVRFNEIPGIAEGASVRVAGRSIGHVRSIAMAKTGGIVVDVRLDRGWADRIPINSEFFVDARSPLAPRYVAIGPPPGHAAPDRAVADGDEVTGVDPPTMDTVLQRTWDNLNQLSEFIDGVMPAAHELDRAIARLGATARSLAPNDAAAAQILSVVDESQAVMRDVYGGHLDVASVERLVARADVCATHITAAIVELRGRIADIRVALTRAEPTTKVEPEARVEVLHALDAADHALEIAEALARNTQAVLREATEGTGSLAAFAADLELVDDVKEMTKQLKRQPWRVAAPPSK